MKHTITLLLALWASQASAQHGDDAHLDIVSSTVCDMCERTIEENLIYEKGVRQVDVDLATSTVHVTYKAGKNTPEGLRAALVKLGYSADGMPGDPKAFAKLPACCQKEGCGKLPTEAKP
ncbi:MAG TPA: heavy metal-associated domain-containing protein [Flavobacteriales bacterium]|nr:heavy-metal-associated domain-containing protein [Flavobacteriales bacterium]HQW85876.1 heavy metal-associated domain-containing protein [Flavobacteriales bacterium]